ncbi:a91fe002-22a3-4a0d-996a-46dba028eb11 [Thermothielavioides terrestris]|uniref:A91fe002-22a3-4a0d-996a-46dba028eb11 n=1 Tax=Thermothielavioides terrestris TaxID=2587410 RepID=A0A446BFI8_9PEZI|nr:a91fe002-22a3-4a0d-996a-46dba028eb11 [Thermothielavioides terrestris]
MAADAANVREELRQEMRAAAVRRLQQPGGVTERVKAWQKANAAAMKQQGGGVPHAEDAASEPTEVAVHVPAESVTEEDRVRIKMRQKPKKKKVKAERSEEKENLGDGDGEETEREQLAGRDSGVASKAPPLVKNAPKKRIVSDDNWMKRRKGGSPPRAAPPKPKAEGSPMPLPKDFLQRTAQNPSVQSKIKDWAERVELPDPQPPRVKRSRHRNSGATVTVEADAPSMPASEPDTPAPPPPPAVDGIRVKPMKPSKSKSDTDDGIRAVPKVFKKVVTGAKDIIQEMAEPPRPVVANQPQSIESWLNGTVDPFVELAPKEPAVKEPKPEEPAPKAQVNTRELTPEAPKLASDIKKQPSPRPPSPGQRKETPVSSAPKKPEPAKEPDSQREESDTTPRKAKSPVTQSTALKRRRATRVAPSSAKSGGRKPFRELLKEAFRGESGGHKLPPTVYPSCETDDDKGSYSGEDNWESADERDRSNDPGKRPASSDYSSAYFSSTYDSTLSSDLSSQSPPRRRPPTNGVHELSTIVSEEPFSTTGSETRSDVSQTTVTQTTAFTKSTGVTRQESRKPSLKRRLTKHSDLVSVLSLPDNGQLVPPSRSKSIKSSRSIHRRPSRASKSNLDKLLDEFADDEHFYGRELKTLVDGVIPVLLRDVTNGEAKVPQADAMAKSVVNMGMALEKLKAFHQRVPLADIDALFLWLEDVSPIYDNYLDVWRLGFQGLVINLAPKHGRFDDNDSLLNAVSLNEDGDVIGENGERVDVAFLLKRPLIRVKWMVKFLKAAAAVTATPEAERLLSVFAALQEKARRRHREETARMMDEDANNTDTTRCRDLRNLLPLGGVMMNRTRQVAALDVFSLDLDHSSGQRLECQVEMIFRDNPAVPSDKGDILIREISNNARSWLLFPPVPRQNISARLGDDKYSLVAMIRGTHNGNEWFELLKLSTNDEEQVEYWTPTRENYPQNSAEDDRRRPSWETPFNTSPKIVRPLPNTTPYREDGAPPPPIHRTFGPKSPGLLSPPVEIGPQARLKRRMSSPLKHEYHPSDVSSESSSSVSDDDSESSQSSSDDLDEDEVPDTIPGYSIKETDAAPVESVVSENSITPSNSASQVAVAHENNAKPERPMQQFVASVSYWSSRKGMWRDINNGKSASVVVRPGCMEVHYLDEQYSNRQAYPLQSSGTSEVDNSNKDAGSVVPLVVLVLTPVVMIRRSTALDLEVRSPASPEARLKIEANMFRFRTATQDEAKELYEAVHISRLNNARYIQLSEEARVRSFGQMQAAPGEGSADGDGSSRRRSWFGRKNSYRASTRAPSVSQGSVSTTISAASFLRRLMGGGDNTSYNIDESTLDKQRPASAAPGGGSLYTSSSASGSGSSTPPRSASVSLSGSGSHSQSRWSYGLAKPFSPDQPLEIRCHLNVQNNRWLDKGNCVLHISRPPPGVRQELPIYHGLEKRVIVTHATKRSGDRPLILLDAVLGSKCFSMLGTKGIMCSVWENLRDEEGNVGVVPRHGVVGGKVTKWCFQCKSVQQAGWIMKLLTSEVPGLMMG